MNLKGGYIILALMSLVLVASEDGTTFTDIEDEETLNQLDKLKEFLDMSKALKPILLRVHTSVDETVLCELARNDEGTLLIHAKLNEYELNIVVTFTQDEDTGLIYIDDAQYLYVADSLKELNVIEGVESGTPVNMLGLDENGELVKANLPASGTKLYKHFITVTNGNITLILLKNDLSNITDTDVILNQIRSVSYGGTNPVSEKIINGYFVSRGGIYLILNYLDNNGDKQEYSLQLSSVESDDVTEL